MIGIGNNAGGFSSGNYNNFSGFSQMQGWQQDNISGLMQGMNAMNLNGEGYDGDQYLAGSVRIINLLFKTISG